MLHGFDSSVSDAQSDRQQWMALLSRAPQELLEQTVGARLDIKPDWLRQPEIGLMMVQGRVGGSGERFNLGEITVTRCALRLSDATRDGHVGVSYVLGRNYQRAKLAAVADALLQDPEQRNQLEKTLLSPVRSHLERLEQARHQRAQKTKVDFMTVARESGSDLAEGEE